MNSEIEMQDLLVGIHQQLTEVRKALKDEQDRTEAILSRISEVNLRVSVACFFPLVSRSQLQRNSLQN